MTEAETFEVFKCQYSGKPFPRELLGTFSTPQQIMDRFNMTWGQFLGGVETGYFGKMKKYMLAKIPKFLHDAAIDETIKRHGDEMTLEQIAGALGVPLGAILNRFDNAKSKLAYEGKLKDLLFKIKLLREIRERRSLGVDMGEKVVENIPPEDISIDTEIEMEVYDTFEVERSRKSRRLRAGRNLEKLRDQSRKYREKNQEKIREYNRKYKEKNREKYRAARYFSRRNSVKNGAEAGA